jgi:hypothetical protein
LLALPVPDEPKSAEVREVERISRRLAEVRAQLDGTIRDAHARQHELKRQLRALTLQLDVAVFRMFLIPVKVQSELAEYFLWLGGPRPGFDEQLVAVPPDSEGLGALFTAADAARMHNLFDVRRDRGLDVEEEAELDALVERWQEAEIERVGRGPLPVPGSARSSEGQKVALS